MKLNRRNFVKQAALGGVGTAVIGSEGISKAFAGPSILKGKDDRIVKLGFIGVGGMGTNLLQSCLRMEDVEIPAICDIDPEAMSRALTLVEKSGRKRPDEYSKNEEDYLNLVIREGATLFFIFVFRRIVE